MCDLFRISIFLACLLSLGLFARLTNTSAFASAPYYELELFQPTPEEIAAQNTDTFFNNINDLYTQAFRKTLKGKHLVAAIIYSDLSSSHPGLENPLLMREAEAQVMTLVRHALYQAVRDTIREIEVLYRLREYGHNLRSAELTIKDGRLDLQGPSLIGAGRNRDPEPGRHDPLRMRLMIDARTQLGLSLRTGLGPVESRVTYFITGDDLIGVSLERKFTGLCSLNLAYRARLEDQRALATFHFFLP